MLDEIMDGLNEGRRQATLQARKHCCTMDNSLFDMSPDFALQETIDADNALLQVCDSPLLVLCN
jgi:hypothetical protein